MEENLVGYLLDALDPDTHRQVEKYLNDEPAGRQQLETLRRALEPLAIDRDHPEPAPGLAFRTLARVAEYRCRPLPQAPSRPASEVGGAARRWWRPRPDLLVAASLLVLLGGIGVPSLVHLRREQNRQACANNLRLLHEALERYSTGHNSEFPAAEPAPHNVAGMFVAKLRDAGVLPERASVRCPENGAPYMPEHSVQDLKRMSPEEFQEAARRLAGCYAYTLGYRDAGQKAYHGLRRDPTQMNNGLLPILADCPSIQGEYRGNSPNHHGGQNVLYIGGHVRYCTDPHAGVEGDHIYLNREGKVAAGVDQWDTVLGCSDDRP